VSQLRDDDGGVRGAHRDAGQRRAAAAPAVDIVLVNRNSGECLRECLTSIARADADGFALRSIIVVDDASTDGSVTGIDWYQLPIRVIRNKEHRGYGASCNLAAKLGDSELLLFLNTDTKVSTGALKGAVSYLTREEHHDVGVVGVKLLDEAGKVSRSCSRFPTLWTMIASVCAFDRLPLCQKLSVMMREWNHLETRVVDQVIGAFMMIRRAVFDQLGGYDERFFVYMEDLDLSVRMRAAGYRSVYLSTSYAIHQGGGTARKAWSESLFFNRRSRIQYALKHFGPGGGFLVALVTAGLEPIARGVRALCVFQRGELVATWNAYCRLWCWLVERVVQRGSAGDWWQACSKATITLVRAGGTSRSSRKAR